MKVLSASFLAICLLSSCSDKAQKPNSTIEKVVKFSTTSDKIPTQEEIEKMLQVKKVEKSLTFDKDKLTLPFNIEMKAKNGGESLFLWQLGDLELNSQSGNFFSFGFEDELKYKFNNLGQGAMNIVWTDKQDAVTIAKVKDQLKDVDAIYYSDNESLIYRERGSVNSVYFKYLKDKKAFALFFSSNDHFSFELEIPQKLELAISQLSLAKNFFKSEPTSIAKDWESYEKSLNSLNLETVKETKSELAKTLESAKEKQFSKLKLMSMEVMPIAIDGGKTWATLQNYYSKKIKEIDGNIFPNSEYSFAKYKNYKVEYSDADAMILELTDVFDHVAYAAIFKTKIQNKEVLLATKNISNWVNDQHSKEMAYFYLAMFRHFSK